MMIDRPNTQALFHFLLCELIVECSEHAKNSKEKPAEQRLREIGRELGFKIYGQICLKRGIVERPLNINELLKNIKSKVFKHLFNYELHPDTRTYREEERQLTVYGIVDEQAIYLTWMPENCHHVVITLVMGMIEGICHSSDLKCSMTYTRIETEKEDKNIIEYQIELENEENLRWDRK